MKYCNSCKDTKNLDLFYVSNRVKDTGRQSICKACMSEANKRIRENHPTEEMIRRRRTYHLKNRYGIGLSDYDEMLAEQQGRCWICREVETKQKKGKVLLLSVDHCHETGRVRGLLCSMCNPAIGMLRNDIGLLARAIEYLSRFDEE